MFGMLKNLTKAVVAVAVTPIDAVCDAVMLVDDAAEGKNAMNRTAKRLSQASDALDAALTPKEDNEA